MTKWDTAFDDATVKFTAFVEAVNEEPMSVLEGPDDLSEMMGETIENPRIVAQLIMNHLGNPDAMSNEDKKYWLTVAEHMGPDWIAKFRKVGAWMEKIELFR